MRFRLPPRASRPIAAAADSRVDRAAAFAVEGLENRVLLASTGLLGTYFNNPTLTGTPAGQRVDKTVNFSWGGTPGVTGVGADNFSVRWTGQVNPLYTGNYTFLTNSDDGVRLFVNGQKVIDNWTKHAATVNSGVATLKAGVKANVTMEFFEGGSGATAQLFWQSKSQAKQIIPESSLSNPGITTTPPPGNPPPANPPPAPGSGNGLLGTYFDNDNFTVQKFTRVDPTLNFNWGLGSPAASVAADTFSVRWTGQVLAQKTETYTFYTKSDDGAKLTVNGKVLIDKLIPQGPTEYAGAIALVAGQKYNLQLDYFDRTGGASASLSWSSPSTPKAIVPKSQLFSTAVVTPPPAVPTVPANVTATALSPTQIKLAWQDVATETSYKLERSLTGTTGWTQIATPAANATTFTDANLSANTKYFYRLRATNAAGDSAYSAIVNATTQTVSTHPPTAPATPATFAAAALSSSQLKLTWADVPTETGYKLERSPDGVASWTQIATPAQNAASFTDLNLAASTTYYYRLRANNSAGDSAYTAVASATTSAVVTPPPPTGTYQPDQVIQAHKDTSFLGDNVINATGDGQTREGSPDFYGKVFKIRVFNDGTQTDSFTVTGPKGDADWRVEYYDSFNFGVNGGVNITAAVTGNGWNTGPIAPGAYRDYRVETLPYDAPGGGARSIALTARSNNDPTKLDVVRANVTNPVVRKVTWRRQNFDHGGTYLMRIENQGNLPDSFTINAALGAGAYTVQFFDDQFGGNDVTAAVRSGAGWQTRVLQPFESQEFRVSFSDYADFTVPKITLTATSASLTTAREQLSVDIPPVEDKPVVTPGGEFPIGVWVQPKSSFAKWKSRGVNTLIEYQGDGATVEQWSQAARDLGLYYIRRPLSNPALDVGDPNLLAWGLPDEPEITTKYPVPTLQGMVDAMHAADPNRPIWVNFSGGYVLGWQGNVNAAGYVPYTNLIDWGSNSIYPVTGWNRPIESPGLDAPGQAVDRLEKWTDGKPQWAVLESSDQELSWIQKEIPGPNPGQFRAEVWDSIIQGARGVIYFPESFSPGFKYDNTSPEIAAEMTAVDAKIQSIAGVLLADIDPPTRGVDVGNDSPLRATWRVVDGKTYAIVLNFGDKSVTQNVTLQGIGGATSATVHGENRSVSLNDGTLTDTFAAYSVHVYQVG